VWDLIFVADIVSCVEFNHDGEFLATGDKGGRVVIFQRDAGVRYIFFRRVLVICVGTLNKGSHFKILFVFLLQSKNCIPKRGEYNVYSTFQSHEPEFDYLKSLEIEEKINKIRWLKRKNPAHFLLSTNGIYIIAGRQDFFKNGN
jgi:serine/threonine-protein phosphatase 2A regulatory subunit B